MKPRISRRAALHSMAGVSTVAVFSSGAAAAPASAPLQAPAVIIPNTTIKKVERTWVDMPLRPAFERNYYRERQVAKHYEIIRVTLGNGVTGFGESAVYDGGRPLSDQIVARVLGRYAAEQMWDDSIGNGLQVALFDAVGKTNGVPVHRLLGRQQRERAFISWWCNDMPKEDWVSEAKDAIALGYTAMKAKARPWFDLHEQLRALTAILPAHFDFDFDFNSMLLDSSRGGPYLASLEQYPNVAIFETPIPQSDVEGNKQLRQATHIPIAMHYGSPPIMTALSQEVCDGFVIGGTSPSRAIQQGNVAAMANKSFWLQMNGTGITATWGTHLAAVLSHARWPAVNVNNLYTESMIRPKFKVENGFAAVPDAPGLGVELDEDAVERYRIEPLKEEPGPPKDMLYAIRFPSGATSYYTDGRKYRRDFEAGLLPVFLRGIHMEPIKDNGSREWREIHAKAQHQGVHLAGRPL